MLSIPINLAIVDDHVLFRKTLKSYLSEQKNFKVVVQASDVGHLLSSLKYTHVDVLLMDVLLREFDGLEALKIVRNAYPKIRVLILSMVSDMDFISDLLENGIHGCVSKNDEPEDLVQAIIAAADGRIFRNKVFTEALYWTKQNNARLGMDEPHPSLNDREKRILQLIWEEKSNKEIADALFLGVRSVEKIRQDIKEKIGAKSTIGLIRYALNKKIVGSTVPNAQ
ncbi:MAG TPA: response regulator transcription factor [Puia sp.]|uniref:response regulator transcription factor n=1 Tax=Puia sp. TaxID=2045100 RepID=UPI002D0A45E5|nr:response regulator transcription factor [Puia sp.]HVU95557.1 response regulator transcription factor [Puia sp.]